MGNTKASEVIESFESSFADKQILPAGLEVIWLKKAAGRYCAELEPIFFDEEIMEFNTTLSQYAIDVLASYMKQLYQERQVSLVNKRVSIASKDISYDVANGAKTAEKAHLEYAQAQAARMTELQKLAGNPEAGTGQSGTGGQNTADGQEPSAVSQEASL